MSEDKKDIEQENIEPVPSALVECEGCGWIGARAKCVDGFCISCDGDLHDFTD